MIQRRVPQGKVKITINLDAELVKRAKIRAVRREPSCACSALLGDFRKLRETLALEREV